MPYDIVYLWNLKYDTSVNLSVEQKQTYRHRKQTMVTKGEKGGE